MMKFIKTLVLMMIFTAPAVMAQQETPCQLELKYNPRLRLVGFDTIINVTGGLDEVTIFNRVIAWFGDDFQKRNVVLSKKDSTGQLHFSINKEVPGSSADGKHAGNSGYMVQGRYMDVFKNHKIGANSDFVICSRIEVQMLPAAFHITLTSFKLPDYGFISFESFFLENQMLKKQYRNLEKSMCNKMGGLVSELKSWIENYPPRRSQWQELPDNSRKNKKLKREREKEYQ
ncbi:MAG: hypothetical protein RBR47_01440 [Bacteroidales bacterium]|jgi:hypothetical protein|nr:hypothetical protein [Bacteroidales bacterium]NCU35717.1 hypothetical protein [Candidatus Falkowbacteria bacterium]MDD2631336.1 hypothetical protein [Bacteroidales bacterium]MDD3525845.1 hypothetical protein [Bacteroidales bacterium]MDD4177455.1 hypothetical protein [Bacteroidales bacterium]